MSQGISNEAEVRELTAGHARSLEVCVPASTSNLGAGFDCFGLALPLYLTVRATVAPEFAGTCHIRISKSEGSELLPRTTDNLIFRAMRFTAARLGQRLPPVRLAVHNEIPLGGGLGSSAAAIVAGVALGQYVCGGDISDEIILRYATEMEGHADNVAPSLYGGWAITCIREDGGVLAIKRRWPPEIKIIAVTPHVPLDTAHARALLPDTVSRADAVHNLQRTALFTAAIDERNYDLVWEAMQDRLHQEHRQALLPGLAGALATPRLPGLIGLALSGAGPTILALALDHFDEIGETVASHFHQHNIKTIVRLLEVDNEGMRKAGVRTQDSARRSQKGKTVNRLSSDC